MKTFVDQVNQLLGNLNEGIDRSELSEAKFIHFGDVTNEFSKKELTSLYKSFMGISKEIGDAMGFLADVAQDYKDEEGKSANLRDVLGEHQKKLADFADYAESLAANFHAISTKKR